MVDAISERYPEDAILSEERGGEISATGRTWLLDPVDGTANFTSANPMFCACVSVVEGGRGDPRRGRRPPPRRPLPRAPRAAGPSGIGQRPDLPLRVSEAGSLEYSFVGADLSLQRQGHARQEPGLRRSSFDSWQLRALGSAGIRGAWLAAGYLDVSIGTRNTAWDYAPTVLLVSEAGGRATDLAGGPWTLDSDGLIATNGTLHKEVLAALAGG